MSRLPPCHRSHDPFNVATVLFDSPEFSWLVPSNERWINHFGWCKVKYRNTIDYKI